MPYFAPQLSVKFRESASLQCGRGYIHTTSAAESTLPGPQSAPLPLTKNANYMPAICAYISDADTTVQKTVAAVQSNQQRTSHTASSSVTATWYALSISAQLLPSLKHKSSSCKHNTARLRAVSVSLCSIRMPKNSRDGWTDHQYSNGKMFSPSINSRLLKNVVNQRGNKNTRQTLRSTLPVHLHTV